MGTVRRFFPTLLILILALSVFGCADNGPSGLSDDDLDLRRATAAGSFDYVSSSEAPVLDAVHGGGNEHFFWLPPLVERPLDFNGTFNGSQSPIVKVCDPTDEACATPVAEFTTDPGAGSESVRVVPEDEHYVVNLDSEALGLEEGRVYRVVVCVSGHDVGHADVRFGSAGDGDTAEAVAFKYGRTVPVKFRLEQGAAAEEYTVSPGTGGTVDAVDGAVSVEVPAGSLTEETTLTVEPIDPTGAALAAVEFGPDGLQFAAPVAVTLAYDEAALGGVAEEDLALNLLDAEGRWIVLPGGTVDTDANTVTAPFHHFSTGGAGPAELAVVCPGDGSPDTFESLQDAMDAVMAGGTVEVCAGTHTVAGVETNKPVTIEGQAGTRPTLLFTGYPAGYSSNGFFVNYDFATVSGGTFAVRNLNVRPDPNWDPAWADFLFILAQRYDQIVIEDVDVEAVIGGLFVWQRETTATAHVTVQHMTYQGGGIGVFALRFSGAGYGPLVDVLNSNFTGDPYSGGSSGAIWYQTGASGLIQNNTVNPCGRITCIRVAGSSADGRVQQEPARIIGNQLTATDAGQTEFALRLRGDLEVRDNVITGVTPGDPNDPNAYSFSHDGIQLQDVGTGTTVTGNTISSAFHGITVRGATVAASAFDNVLATVGTGVRVIEGGQLTAYSIDVTDYVAPISTEAAFGTGDLTCNWWGSAGGPAGVDPAISSDVYTPWATAPVAGTSTTTCTGGN